MEEDNFRGTWFTEKNPKRGVNQVPRKLSSSIAFYKSLQSGLAMDLINTPMPRVSCPNDENPEKKQFEKKKKSQKIFFFKIFFLRIFIIWTTNPWHGGVYKAYGKSRLQGFKKHYGGSKFSRYLIHTSFGGFWEAWTNFKKPEMDKTLRNGIMG